MLKASKTRKRIIAVVSAVAIFAGALFTALQLTEATAYAAKVTLRGIEDIVNAHTFTADDENPKPFVIVEVVPTMNDAALGYLVAGEEPIYEGKSIKDMPSKTERERYINGKDYHDVGGTMTYEVIPSMSYNPAIDPNTNPDNQRPNVSVDPNDPNARKYDIAYDLNGKAFTWSEYHEFARDYAFGADESYRESEIRGEFAGDDDGAYITGDMTSVYEAAYGNGNGSDVDPSYPDVPSITTIYGQTVSDIGELYRRTVAFRLADDFYTGEYYFDITRISDVSEMPVSVEGLSYPDELYNWQYFSATKISDTEELAEGDWVFTCEKGTAGDTLNFFGIVKADPADLDADENPIKKIYLNDGDVVLFSELEDVDSGSHTPPLLLAPRPNMASPSPTPTGDVTPTPTATGDEMPTPTATETATQTPDSNPDGEPTATPDGSDSVSPTDVPQATPEGEPTAAPDTSSADDSSSNDSGDGTDPTAKGRYYGSLADYVTYSGVRGIGDTAVLGALDEDRTLDYYVVTESSSGEYRISTVYDTGSDASVTGPFGRKTGYTRIIEDEYNETTAASNKGPYFKKVGDADEYAYDPKDWPGASTEADRYRFITNYSLAQYQLFRYNGGFNNYEWFKQYVFDRNTQEEYDSLYIDVKTVHLEDLGKYIDDANLIYFAGGKYPNDSADKDISVEDAIKLYSKVVNENFPVMMERSTYYANADVTNPNREYTKNLQLLSLLLMQGNYKDVPSTDEWAWILENDLATNPETPYTLEDLLDGLYYASYIPQDPSTIDPTDPSYMHDLSYVHGTIFVNDDCNWSLVDDGAGGYTLSFPENPSTKIVRSDFKTKYTDEKISGSRGINGFTEIIDEFANERPIIETYGSWDDFNSEISKATCIRYILNANNNRYAVKTVLNILDLEPYESAQYDVNSLKYYRNTTELTVQQLVRDNLEKNWIRDNLDFEGDLDKVGIVQIGTKEFIGMNQDLNATYDMIYIGMDTTIMNTSVSYARESYGKKTNETLYNDSNMKGLIYSHVGDEYYYNHFNSGDYRASGNDITFDKKRELSEYIKAGYSVILSDSFFVTENGKVAKDDNGHVSINTTTLDTSSNMYKFVRDVVLATNDDGNYIYFGKNVMYKGALESATEGYANNRVTFARYLNISKLTIEAIKVPKAYNSEVTDRYLDPNAAGEYSLDFEVNLKNDAALSDSGTTYNCKLYIDLDADGKYEEGESMSNLVINGGSVSPDADGRYHLRAGNTYTISRPVPEEYVGFLAWKLAFVQNDNDTVGSTSDYASVRSAIIGYSAVKAQGSKPTVNILQIVPDFESEQTFDLDSTEMNALYDQVEDFDVQVYQVTVSNFVKKTGTTPMVSRPWELSYFDNLCHYDMLVCGFMDCFDLRAYGNAEKKIDIRNKNGSGTTSFPRADVSYDLMLAVREYALSGRSILFTHDLTSMYQRDNDEWGHFVNEYLRDIQGMDRYGITNANTASLTYKNANNGSTSTPIKAYQSIYDSPLLKGEEKDKIGYTDSNLIRYTNSYSYGLTSMYATHNYDTNTENMIQDNNNPVNGVFPKKETVTAINEGQITQYPFLITEGVGGAKRGKANSTFDVAFTHDQYYQLNLDTDSRDENTDDDVVVWYAISNTGEDGNYQTHAEAAHKYYQAMHNDVRNNYYLYSKGNVMYTGAGHSVITDDLERKLFVNALVASYNSGLHAPKVTFKENPWDSSANVSGVYLPYDVNMTRSEDAADENGGFLTDKITVNFKTMNNNFRETSAKLAVKYYVKSSIPSDLNVGTDYYKEITPLSFKGADPAGNLVDLGTGAAYSLDNYKVYQATFSTADINAADSSGLIKEDSVRIYIQIGLEKDGLSSGTVSGEKATESIKRNMLAVYTTKLFDLE